MVKVKRYANGRFYDTEEKTYIRREQIAGMLAAKKAFVIVDTKTGNDITEEIVAQISARQEKAAGTTGRRQEPEAEAPGPDAAGPDAAGPDEAGADKAGTAPEGALLDFLRKSGDSIYQWGRKYAAKGQDLLADSWRELDKRINRLVAEEKISESEGRDLRDGIKRQSDSLRNWLSSQVDKAVEDGIRRLNLASREELNALSETVESLRQRVEQLEKERSRGENQ